MTSQLHDVPAEVAEVDEIHAFELDDELEVKSGYELPPGVRLIKTNAGLFITPILVIVGSILLYSYIQSADKIFQDERALDWDANLRPQLEQHLSLTLWSTVFTIVMAVPLGILLTRPKYKRIGSPILAVATSGQAIPAFGLLVLAFAWLGRGPWTTIWALSLFTLLPVLRNTMVGLEQVDKNVIEAGRGMGLTKRQALRQIELPLAIPVILAGVRTALGDHRGHGGTCLPDRWGRAGDHHQRRVEAQPRPGTDHGSGHDRTRRVDGRLDRRADREDASAQGPVTRFHASAASARPRSNTVTPNTEHLVNTNKEKTLMRIKRQTMRFAAGLAAVALVAGACGSDDDSSDGGDDGAATTEASDSTEAGGDDGATAAECETAGDEDNSVASLTELDFSGLDINVGSKDFVEQFVLGQLAIAGLEAGGANVTDSTNLGGTVVNRDALLAGEIDTYWEYNGTGWTVHLAQEDPSFDPVELTNAVCAMDLAENDIRWLGVSPFNNTYGFATAGDSPAAGGDLQAMMEYVNENSDATVCMETEYPNRPDGLVLLEEATGLTIPADQQEILETGVIYEETANGNCTFGEIFTTDGRIPPLASMSSRIRASTSSTTCR